MMSIKKRRVQGGVTSRTAILLAGALVLTFGSMAVLHGASGVPIDPGVQTGNRGTGNPLPRLTPGQTAFFGAGQFSFNETIDVQAAGNTGVARYGLGPGFNSNSCFSCHSQPASGGSGPLLAVKQPEIVAGMADGASNTIPAFFIFQGGPVREARFVYEDNSAGTVTTIPDGGVHNLFTIAGRVDAPGCSDPQPNFSYNLSLFNVIFRIPTPVFGDGLLEMIQDQTILNEQATECNNSSVTGVCGVPNPSPNTGTIDRFGWKAQDPSMLVFSGEASNVETGVTNELFPVERDETYGCQFTNLPESQTNFSTTATGTNVPSEVENIGTFMRFLDQPKPGACPGNAPPGTAGMDCVQGEADFFAVGCADCHNETYVTNTRTAVGAMSGIPANLWSDLLVHHMGPALADCVTQGAAMGDMFRTAPLWGVGQREFFMHNGGDPYGLNGPTIDNNLYTAIELHSSAAGPAVCGQGVLPINYGPSEANYSITKYNALSVLDQQDVLYFLRSL